MLSLYTTHPLKIEFSTSYTYLRIFERDQIIKVCAIYIIKNQTGSSDIIKLPTSAFMMFSDIYLYNFNFIYALFSTFSTWNLSFKLTSTSSAPL